MQFILKSRFCEFFVLQIQRKLNSRMQTAFQKPVMPQFIHTSKTFHTVSNKGSSGVHKKISDPSDTATRKDGCCAEPHTHQQEGIPWGCEGQRQ